MLPVYGRIPFPYMSFINEKSDLSAAPLSSVLLLEPFIFLRFYFRFSVEVEMCRMTVSGLRLTAALVQGGILFPRSVSPMPRDMYVPLSIHPASLSAASFLFSLRSLSNAASAISRLGIFIVVSISFHFQFAVSLSFPLSFAARTPKGRSSILWLKHSVEL